MKRILIAYIVFAVFAFGDEPPKPAAGFAWHRFARECVVLQVPDGWMWREKDNHPAQSVAISPEFNKSGGYDSGFTLNAVSCHNEKEWNDAYHSALKLWATTADEVKKLGKPTLLKSINKPEMQLLVVEGDMYLPNAPHPHEKYRVRTYMRALPGEGLVYYYSVGALTKDWDAIWKAGSTMMEPIIFELPGKKEANQAPDSTASAGTSAAGQPRVPASSASRL